MTTSDPIRTALFIDGVQSSFPVLQVSRDESLSGIPETWVRVGWGSHTRSAFGTAREVIGHQARIELRRGDEPVASYTGHFDRVVAGTDMLSMRIAGGLQRLCGDSRSENFVDLCDAEIARQVLSSSGVAHRLQVSAGSARPFVRRQQETDFEFLSRLAHQNGWAMYEFEDEVVVTQGTLGEPLALGVSDLPAGSGSVDLSVGVVRTDATTQLHDPHETARVRVDTLPGTGPTIDLVRRGSDALFGEARHAPHFDAGVSPEHLQVELEARAKSTGAGLARLLLQASHPAVRVGRVIRHPDPEFVGEDMVVVACRFAHGPGKKFIAEVEAVPLELFAGPVLPRRSHGPGLALAEVVDVGDATRLGSVGVQMYDGGAGVLWARVSNRMAGTEHGSHWTPRIGAQVVLGFLDCMREQPVVLGCLYHADSPPVFRTDRPCDEVLLVQTRGGTTIRVEEQEDRDLVEIRQGSENHFVLLSGEQPSVRLRTTGRFDIDADEICIQSRSFELNVTESLSANGGRVAANARDGMELKSDGPLRMEGGEVGMKGDRLFLQGKATKIEATEQAEIEGDRVTVKGKTTKVQADGKAELKGKVVKIN